MLLHDAQELDNDLGAGADEDLALARLLGVVDGVERIVEDGGLDHFEGLAEILKRRFAVGGICRKIHMLALRSHERKECPSVCKDFVKGSSARRLQVKQYHHSIFHNAW